MKSIFKSLWCPGGVTCIVNHFVYKRLYFFSQIFDKRSKIILFICYTLPWTDTTFWWDSYLKESPCYSCYLRLRLNPSLPSKTRSVWSKFWDTCCCNGSFSWPSNRGLLLLLLYVHAIPRDIALIRVRTRRVSQTVPVKLIT